MIRPLPGGWIRASGGHRDRLSFLGASENSFDHAHVGQAIFGREGEGVVL